MSDPFNAQTGLKLKPDQGYWAAPRLSEEFFHIPCLMIAQGGS
jgi:hypothetical protein